MIIYTLFEYIQWRIQDFPEEGRQLSGGGANIRFCQIFPKTAWNWKNLDPQGGASKILLCRSATDTYISINRGWPYTLVIILRWPPKGGRLLLAYLESAYSSNGGSPKFWGHVLAVLWKLGAQSADLFISEINMGTSTSRRQVFIKCFLPHPSQSSGSPTEKKEFIFRNGTNEFPCNEYILRLEGIARRLTVCERK